MNPIINFSQYITILGLIITLSGVHKLHQAVRANPAVEIKYHTKQAHDAAIIDFYQAREGLRYTIYGFLIQMLTVIL